MTGIGQSVGAARRTGTDRAIDVANKMGDNPINQAGDPALSQLKTAKDLRNAAAARSMPETSLSDPCYPLSSKDSKGFFEATTGSKPGSIDNAPKGSPSSKKPGPRRLAKPQGAVQSGV